MRDRTHETLSPILSSSRKNQARLRLVKSDDLDLCSSCNLTAASPLGSDVRPVSISLTEEGVKPTSVPISAKVIPLVRRRSVMRDAQVIMPPNIRQAVDTSQRQPVTGFRENPSMPPPAHMPMNLVTIGARVRWWRQYRKLSRKELAKAVGYSITGLSDLELERSNASEKLGIIAAELRLNAHYLQYGEGEPEAAFPQEAPPKPDEWLFPAVPRAKLKKYNKIERSYLETKLLEAIADIDTERRSKTG